jgi:hypothetical protein
MRPLTRLRVAYGAVLVLTPRLLTRALPHQQIDAREIAFATRSATMARRQHRLDASGRR